MQRIVTLTINPAVDESTAVESVAAEIKLRCEAPRYDAGGGGINVSRAIHKLGGVSIAVYTQGGPNGDLLSMLLRDEGLRQEPVPISGMTRQSFTVFERSTTLQYRFGMPGPHLSEAEWRACLDACLAIPADFIVGSGSLPPGVPDDFYAQLIARAKPSGAKVIIDTSGAALKAVFGVGAFLLKPNIAELETLIGAPFGGEHNLRATTQALVRDGLAQALVISLGAGGAALVTADTYTHFRAPVVPVQSKVGAGDSMVGGLTLALAQGRPLADAARYGVAAGTAAVMTPGTELCRKEDTEQIYQWVSA